MKIQNVDGQEERDVLCGMIVDSAVLGRIASKWRGNMFRARWSNTIAQWCIGYFKEYQKAPGKAIKGLFADWASVDKDKETIALVERYLVALNDEYQALAKESNSQYIIDVAAKHFTRVGLTRLVEDVQALLDAGKVKASRRKVVEYEMVEMGMGAGVDVLRDEIALQEALSDNVEPLVEYPGALGQFFKGHLQRDGFIAILAPEKRGKSYGLEDIAWRAMLQRRKVAFFSAGDLSQNQMMRRFVARAARRPIKAGRYRFPVAVRKLPSADVEVRFEEREAGEPINWREAKKAFHEVLNKTKTGDAELIRLSTHAMGSLTVPMMDALLDDWAREGWVPDIVIVDYIDIVEEEEGDDERSKTNKKWKRLRGMSQKRHILVVTATQANAGSYTADVMGKANFSEDKRKLAHVTGMFGINQSNDEKVLGVTRLNWIVLREGEFYEDQCVYVAGCLAVAAPWVKSCWKRKAETESEK